VKRLRYALDFFASLLPRQVVRDWERALSAMQECLGTIQDAASALRLLQSLESAIPESLRIFAEGYGAAVQHVGLAEVIQLSARLDRLGKLR
jgi:triphosphatase